MAALTGKRLLFVITKSNWGGAQSYVHSLAVAAKAEGADVAVALGGIGLPGSDTGMLATRLREAGIRIIVVESFARDISVLREWRTFKELRALIARERPDILHLNSSKAGGIGALAARLAKVPCIVFTAHGWAHHEPRPPFARLVIRLASWATVVLSHVVIVVSEGDRKTAPVLFSRKKLRVVKIGVASCALVPREEARAFIAPSIAALDALPKWLFMTAELTKNKGVDVAIRAFAGVSTNVDDAALVIAGEGEGHGELTALIEAYGLKKRVFLLGFVPNVRQYLKAADVLLMPSRKEGMPMALLEAGHAGLPVIASAVGGIPEVIEGEKNGLLIRSEDVDGLADSMTRLLSDPVEAKRFGDALQQTVMGNFSADEMLRATMALYIKE